MKDERIDWLDKHSNASANLIEIVYQLEALAKAFKITGNDAMHKELAWIANDISVYTKEIRDAMTASIMESINRSAESSKTLLAASLAGMIIAKKTQG